MALTTVEKAVKLAELGISVFPFRITKDGEKRPLLPNGHTGSSSDPEQVATWFSGEFKNALIGINQGASGPHGLVTLDLDKKNGLDGEQAIDGWVDTPDTWSYATPTGGRHMIYLAPAGIHLAPARNYRGFEGVDVRAGSSWAGYYADTVPDSLSAFAPAPAWLLTPARDIVGAQFEGGLDEWLETLIDPDGEPTGRVLDAISRIPDYDFDHVEMVERTFEFIRLGAEGHPGVLHGLNLLREAWLREPYNTYNYRYDFDKAIDSGIRKAGALEERIANLPEYAEVIARADRELVNMLVGEPREKSHWFNTAKSILRHEFTDDEALSLLWNAGTTKALTRDWGIEFCAQRVEELRKEVAEQHERSEKEANLAAKVEEAPINREGVSLLTDRERRYLRAHGTFIHRYIAHANQRFQLANPPYHAANAWTILSLWYGQCGFVPVAGKTLGLNLFQMTPGDSSSGKSDSIIMRQEILRSLFAHDLRFDIGAEASPEMLHEEMLAREGAPTFFNTDEAAGFFAKLAQHGSWSAGLEDKITDWYGGWVGPVTKRAAKASLGDANKGGHCYLVSHFFATPERLFSYLSTEQFQSGFLARFQWSFGHPAVDDEGQYEETQPDAREDKFTDQWVVDLVDEMKANKEHIGSRRPIKADQHLLDRLSANRRLMKQILERETDWKITGTAYRRLCDVLRKCAALLALSRGSTKIELIDILGTIEQAEVWVDGLICASQLVSSSAFEREAREIALAVKSMASPVWVSDSRLYRRFSHLEPREFKDRTDWAIRQGLIVFQAAGGDHKDRWAWKGGVDDD